MSESRTLLLTDVVDSTQLTAALGDEAAAQLWAAHDRIARDLLQSWQGLEIDKTDGMLLLFDEPDQARAYADAYHLALQALPTSLRARAGLHFGPIVLRRNAPEDVARGAKPLEVDGLAKPLVARVMALAQGGQTLLTSEALQRLSSGGDAARSHGHWMLKGIAEPVELFELAAAGGSGAAPGDGDKAYRVAWVGERWVSARQVPNNLPQQATSFVGRERELAEIKAQLETKRLVTLLGMGGLGKTRLSLQVAAELTHRYPDGVWFLDLAPLREPGLVVAEAAQVLGVREEPGRSLLQTLSAHLKGRRTLLILDNCEHLVAACAEFAHAVLRSAPEASLLASSREALRVPGEQVYGVAPLPLPARDAAPEVVARSVAVRLFVDRAQAHKPGFSVTERDARALAELVSRLEGIPWRWNSRPRVRVLSITDINARLKDRYKLLTGGGRVLLERQQTLRALVDWSYDMLTEGEQTLLRRLGVFVGGHDLEAAEAICGVDPLDALEVLDLLGSLAEKSLVTLDDSGETSRYRMLETIREYAREKLTASGELPLVAARHAEHYFAFAKEGKKALMGPQQAEWIWRLEAEHDNIRAGIATAMAGGVDPFIAVKFATMLQGFWILRGYCSEGRNLVLSALEMPAIQASELAQSHALYVGAALAESQGDYAEALQMLETCLVLRRNLGQPMEIAATLSTLTPARLAIGDIEHARDGEREALAIFQSLRDRYCEAVSRQHLGQISMHAAEYDEAREQLEQSLGLAQSLKHQEITGENELLLGQVALICNDRAQACQRFQRSLTVCRDAGDKHGEAHALWWLGRADLDAGELVLARRRLEESLRSFRAFEMHEHLVGCLEDHVALALAEGDTSKAVSLSSAVTGLRQRLGLSRAHHVETRWQAMLATLRADGGAVEEDWARGRSWELDETVKQALSSAAVFSAPQAA